MFTIIMQLRMMQGASSKFDHPPTRLVDVYRMAWSNKVDIVNYLVMNKYEKKCNAKGSMDNDGANCRYPTKEYY